jgi:hypothetical protein
MKIVRLMLVLAAVLGIAALTGCGLFPGKIVVQNNSIYTVYEVYISPSDESSWGDDWLTGSIAPGSSEEFEGVGADDYDIMAIEGGGGGWVTGDIVGEPVSVRAFKTYTWTLTNSDYIP